MKTLLSAFKNRNQQELDFSDGPQSHANPFVGLRDSIKERSHRKRERRSAGEISFDPMEGMSKL